MARKLTDVRPCDNCSGPVGLIFYVVRTSIAVINPQAAREYFGMHQFFGGKGSDALVMNFAPHAHDALKIAMDEDESRELMHELFLCQSCHNGGSIDLAMLVERINARREKENVQSAEGGSTAAVSDSRGATALHPEHGSPADKTGTDD